MPGAEAATSLAPRSLRCVGKHSGSDRYARRSGRLLMRVRERNICSRLGCGDPAAPWTKGDGMPTVIGHHDVKDTEHWLASPKRTTGYDPAHSPGWSLAGSDPGSALRRSRSTRRCRSRSVCTCRSFRSCRSLHQRTPTRHRPGRLPRCTRRPQTATSQPPCLSIGIGYASFDVCRAPCACDRGGRGA